MAVILDGTTDEAVDTTLKLRRLYYILQRNNTAQLCTRFFNKVDCPPKVSSCHKADQPFFAAHLEPYD